MLIKSISGEKVRKIKYTMKSGEIMNKIIKPTSVEQESFSHIVELIVSARNNTLRKINEELILLYWNIGKYLSNETKKHSWGDKYIDKAADFLKSNHPDLRGFNKRGLYRMRQFYETYKDDQIVSALLTQLTWAMSRTISPTLVSKYKLELPDKKLLEKHLNEISNVFTK